MKSSEDIFELVHSLDKPEKIHFSLYSNYRFRGKERGHIKLFNAILSQQAYREDRLKEKFRNEPLGARFAVVKNYLYHALLNALTEFRKRSGTDMAIRRLVAHAEILYGKSLYAQCRKMLSAAKELAMQYERFELQLEILRWEEKIIPIVFDEPGHALHRLDDEKEQLLRKLLNIHAYAKTGAVLSSFEIKKGKVRQSKDLRFINRQMRGTLQKGESGVLSQRAGIIYYRTRGFYYYLKGDTLLAYQWRKKLVEMMERERSVFKGDADSYLKSINHLIASQIELKKYDEALLTIRKQNAVPANDRDTKTRLLINNLFTDIGVYIFLGRFDEGVKLLDSIQGKDEFTRLMKQLSGVQKVPIYFNIINAHFGSGNHAMALHWTNLLLNEYRKVLREDYLSVTKLLNLILHYEMGNADLIEYFIRSTYRYLIKRKRLYRFEMVLLEFFAKDIPKIDNASHLQQVFESLHGKLKQIFRAPLERNILEYFDFLSWLEAKISGVPFAEIVREKAAGRVGS